MSTVKQTDFRVGNAISPLVEIKLKPTNDASHFRFIVDCHACGGMVQITGMGGYADIEDAKIAQAEHRHAHLTALQEEIEAAERADAEEQQP